MLKQATRRNAAGFDSIATHWLALEPPAVCVIGTRGART